MVTYTITNTRKLRRPPVFSRRQVTTVSLPLAVGDSIRKMLQKVMHDTLQSVDLLTTKMVTAVHELHRELELVKETQKTLASKFAAENHHWQSARSVADNSSILAKQVMETEKATRDDMCDLKRRLNQMEQLTLDCDVIVSNVEATPDECPTDVITNIGAKLNLPIGNDEIEFCTRLKSKNSNQISPILVRFSKYATKQAFVNRSQKKQLFNRQVGGDSQRRIFINQRLSESYQKLQQVLRGIGSRSGYRIWYNKACFFLQTPGETNPIEIRCIEDVPPNLFH